jgi:hypothetical protein
VKKGMDVKQPLLVNCGCVLRDRPMRVERTVMVGVIAFIGICLAAMAAASFVQ